MKLKKTCHFHFDMDNERIFEAVYKGDLENIKSLVINGCDVNTKTLLHKSSLLHIATRSGHHTEQRF